MRHLIHLLKSEETNIRRYEMIYVKAKFIKGGVATGRSYTFKTEDDVKPGDIVTDAKGSKLIVVEESVDIEWIRAYGAEKVGIVKKYIESEQQEVKE